MTAPAGAGTRSTSAIHYVALGDSRAAGPTWSSFMAGDGCARTRTGYPNIVAAALRTVSFADVACSGATTDNIVSVPQLMYAPKSHHMPAQIAALRPDTTLVTLSIGGNDLRWTSLIGPCFGPAPGGDQRCRHNTALTSEITHRLERLGPAVDGVLAAIRLRSPAARIVLVGHGGYFGPRGCYPYDNAHGADAAYILRFFHRFNTVLRDSAIRHGDTFVDIAGPAVGHDACASPARRWFTGVLTPGDTPFFHPTPLGSAAMARLVLAAIRG